MADSLPETLEREEASPPETKPERREKKRQKRRAKMLQHGKGLAKVYKNAVQKRTAETKQEQG